ncbi:MAG: helix-turn-helix domain-containing protein [Suilimivivens sp.]
MFTIPTINMVKTGQNIIQLREMNGMSVKDLQAIFGFATPQATYKWQQGTALPTIDNLVLLAAVFQVHTDDILAVDAVTNLPTDICMPLIFNKIWID